MSLALKQHTEKLKSAVGTRNKRGSEAADLLPRHDSNSAIPPQRTVWLAYVPRRTGVEQGVCEVACMQSGVCQCVRTRRDLCNVATETALLPVGKRVSAS
jgi:hypothetical protein